MKSRETDKSYAFSIAEAVLWELVVNYRMLTEWETGKVDIPAIVASVEAPEPYCYVVSGCSIPFYGEFAEIDAKQEAKRVGGTCEAIPLYKSPPASEINRQLLDAAKEALESGNDGDWQSARKALASAIAAAEKELK